MRQKEPRREESRERGGSRHTTLQVTDRADSILAETLDAFCAKVNHFCLFTCARCSVPECEGISQSDPALREGLWDRYCTAAPRPRMPSELRYSDRRLRSKT